MKDPFDGYFCRNCGKTNLPLTAFYTYKTGKRTGRRYKSCKECTVVRNQRNDTPLLTGGISYKKALPTEKWSEMRRFLAALAVCASVADKSRVEPDVWNFISTYREVKGRL